MGRSARAPSPRDWIGSRPSSPSDRSSRCNFGGTANGARSFVGREALNRSALSAGHPHHAALVAVRRRLTPSPLFWFRTCETFGAARGHEFAQAWTDFFGGFAAGHTHVIGYWQSGLHRLRAGALPALVGTRRAHRRYAVGASLRRPLGANSSANHQLFDRPYSRRVVSRGTSKEGARSKRHGDPTRLSETWQHLAGSS